MATKLELMKQALQEMEQATISPEEWANRIQHGYNGKPYNYKNTHNWNAQKCLEAAVKLNPSPAPSLDLRDVQRCLFLTDDISRALETEGRLLIATADLGYRQRYTEDFLRVAKLQGRLRVWCDCRPSPYGTPPQVALDWLDELRLPHDYFYGQCESPEEFDAAYNAGARKMVGNMSVLHPNAVNDPRHDQLDRVSSGEVHVTNETYYNVNPNYRVDWRNAAGVGSNTMAVYESDREGAHYYSLVDQTRDGKYNPGTDCVYVAGFLTRDWDYVIDN